MSKKSSEKVGSQEVMKFEPRNIPLFWMNEQTGRMKQIVMKFLEEKCLTNQELKNLRWYLTQWIDAMVSKPPNYKEKIEKSNQKELQQYLGVLLDYGIDPL